MSRYKDTNWEYAACQGTDSRLFYDLEAGEAGGYYPLMRRICNACPIKKECAEWSIRHEEFGFWAGMSERQRWLERRKLKLPLKSLLYKMEKY
jgi:WhiB family redox-sensing transcriptional regulator